MVTVKSLNIMYREYFHVQSTSPHTDLQIFQKKAHYATIPCSAHFIFYACVVILVYCTV